MVRLPYFFSVGQLTLPSHEKREETSAKDNINIDKAARLLVSKILERTKGEIPDTPDGEGKFKVTDDGGGKKGSEGGCCG